MSEPTTISSPSPLNRGEHTNADLEAATAPAGGLLPEHTTTLSSRVRARLREDVRPSMLVEIELTILTL